MQAGSSETIDYSREFAADFFSPFGGAVVDTGFVFKSVPENPGHHQHDPVKFRVA